MRLGIFLLALSMVSAEQVQQGQPPHEGQPSLHELPQMQGQTPTQGQPPMEGQLKEQFEGHPQNYQQQPGKYFYQE